MALAEQIDNSNPDEIACLMVPVCGRMLLVPSTSVAEIVPFTAVSRVVDSPDWLLGNYHWRELKVPLISFEQINGEVRPDLHSRCRVAVLNTTGQSDSLPFVAIMTQGIPRLARVTEDDLQQLDINADKKPFQLMHVSLAGEEAFVPDIEAMEKAYLELV
jgi:chemosensory pili system protein ChpC